MSLPALLAAEHFYAVDKQTLEQTIAESEIDTALSIDLGSVTIHHGERYGKPIVIVQHHDQKSDELSGIWFADGDL